MPRKLMPHLPDYQRTETLPPEGLDSHWANLKARETRVQSSVLRTKKARTEARSSSILTTHWPLLKFHVHFDYWEGSKGLHSSYYYFFNLFFFFNCILPQSKFYFANLAGQFSLSQVNIRERGISMPGIVWTIILPFSQCNNHKILNNCYQMATNQSILASHWYSIFSLI